MQTTGDTTPVPADANVLLWQLEREQQGIPSQNGAGCGNGRCRGLNEPQGPAAGVGRPLAVVQPGRLRRFARDKCPHCHLILTPRRISKVQGSTHGIQLRRPVATTLQIPDQIRPAL